MVTESAHQPHGSLAAPAAPDAEADGQPAGGTAGQPLQALRCVFTHFKAIVKLFVGCFSSFKGCFSFKACVSWISFHHLTILYRTSPLILGLFLVALTLFFIILASFFHTSPLILGLFSSAGLIELWVDVNKLTSLPPGSDLH